MISSLRGVLLHVERERAAIDVGGFGVEVLASGRTLSSLATRVGAEVTVLTYLHLVTRSDTVQLFAFADARERELFVLLTSVGSVGPKLALVILSSLSASDLQVTIAREDVKKLESISGVGKRTAQRIVVELKDKMGALGAAGESAAAVGEAPLSDSFLEARSALQNMGLPLREAEEALRGAPEGAALEELLRFALTRDRSAS